MGLDSGNAVYPANPGFAFWDGLLKGVSRSFYLTIRALPMGMRRPVAAAYLLARAADTIADTRALPPGERLERLLDFRDQVRGPADADAVSRIVSGVRHGGAIPSAVATVTAAETVLLDSAGGLFALLESLPEADRARVRSVVVTLTRAMEMDLTVFPAENSGDVAALKSAEELDGYTYLAAGCVGEFWTATAMAHQPRLSRWSPEGMNDLGVRFGKALQLTNVLRDVPRDLRAGRCYLPEAQLAAAGLDAAALLDPGNAARAWPVLVSWIGTALGHFGAAESYLLATPRGCLRLRLAVLWPILLGMATLEKLARNDQWLNPQHPARVNRRWVYGMMARSLLAAPSDALLRFWIRRLRCKAHRAVNER